MTCLVTGASGFLGGKLVQRLLADGREDLALLTRSGSNLSNIPQAALDRCRILPADGTTQIIEAVKSLAPEIVYHCAGRVLTDHESTDVDDIIQSNLGFTTGLLEGLGRSVSIPRMVMLGTYLEHDASGADRPNSLYAATKLAMGPIETYYEQYHALRLVTIKPSLIYGPGERRPRLMKLLIATAVGGGRLQLSPGEQVLNFVHVDDVVSAILIAGARCAATTTPMRETYFALSKKSYSLRDTVTRIEEIVGRKLDVVWGAKPYKDSEVMMPYLQGKPVPGWTPVFDLQSGIHTML